MDIKSTENVTVLSIDRIDRDSAVADQFSIGIEGAQFSGSKAVYIYETSSIPDHFRKFQTVQYTAEPTVCWQSTEEDLSLELFSRDSLGHIGLRVTLRDAGGNPPWSVTTELILELGQFDRIVDDLDRLFSDRESSQ